MLSVLHQSIPGDTCTETKLEAGSLPLQLAFGQFRWTLSRSQVAVLSQIVMSMFAPTSFSMPSSIVKRLFCWISEGNASVGDNGRSVLIMPSKERLYSLDYRVISVFRMSTFETLSASHDPWVLESSLVEHSIETSTGDHWQVVTFNGRHDWLFVPYAADHWSCNGAYLQENLNGFWFVCDPKSRATNQ